MKQEQAKVLKKIIVNDKEIKCLVELTGLITKKLQEINKECGEQAGFICFSLITNKEYWKILAEAKGQNVQPTAVLKEQIKNINIDDKITNYIG